MDNTIKAHDIAYKEKKGSVKHSVSDYIKSAILWWPNKYSDYQRIRQIHQDLEKLEKEVFDYKLHWGFSKDSPLELRASGVNEMAEPSQEFLALDDLGEAVRSLLFQLNSYSLLEKLIHFDVTKHELLIQEHQRDFARMVKQAS